MPKKLPPFLHKILTYGLAILLGSFLTVGILQVSPSQAAPSTPPPPPTRESVNNFVTAAVNRVGASVVRIDTERTVTTRQIDPFFDDPFFRRFFGDEFPQRSPMQQRLRGEGSGFIIDKSGIILTNAHVVDNADKVTVTLKDGRQFEGQVRGADEVTDLAVVKINTGGKDLPVAPLGDSSAVQVGDWAIAVGNPLGLDNTVTLGIISTLRRSSTEVGVPNKRLDFIQTDAAINPGNSGGPLLNAAGEVIGINTAIRADAMGIGFAIPINKAKEISGKLVRGESVAHPYLGIQMTTLTPQQAKENNDDPNSAFTIPEVQGVLVVRVLPNTPAASAGLRRGDVILQIDGQPVTSADQLQNMVERSRVGQELQLTVQRGNQTSQIAVRTAQLENVN
ncbi:HhoA/HhoB/HtrA family serine endopeptidase [Microseira wollei]|uniref:HtrA2 peptidase n=1 Tax=Microseira wollei NIES-4236 TaxID=2530354 RepID=A0AAV3XLE3_9CYAN|nr:HhoA/HhoB/HtrA family serine endopeptidase [Microseira wollei]GET41606.1 HtrA2 peptidase [Microseira wollei NIES-4236]